MKKRKARNALPFRLLMISAALTIAVGIAVLIVPRPAPHAAPVALPAAPAQPVAPVRPTTPTPAPVAPHAPAPKPVEATTTSIATTSPVIARPYPDARQQILDELNTYRAQHGLDPLTRNDKLDASSKAKADAMVRLNFFAHKDPDGADPWHYFADAGYRFTYAGENLSKDYTPEQAVKAWIASPTHRANILDPHYTETGIAIEGPYIVQHFGRPAN